MSKKYFKNIFVQYNIFGPVWPLLAWAPRTALGTLWCTLKLIVAILILSLNN